MNRPNVAAGLFGFTLGVMAMFAYQVRSIDHLRLAYTKLQQEYNDLDIERHLLVLKLEQSTPKETIQGIQVEGQSLPPGVSQLDLNQWVKNELKFLIGTELNSLKATPSLPMHFLDDKIFTVDQSQYKVQVIYTIISETLKLGVTLTPVVPR